MNTTKPVSSVSAPSQLVRFALEALCSWLLLLCLNDACIAQESAQPTITVRSNLVMVPVFVNTKKGEPVFDLKGDDFRLTDNGVPQRLALERDTDSEPLALAIVVETGGAGATHLADYQTLDSVLEALIGDVEHIVAVVGFDSTPRLIVPFTPKTEDASTGLATLSPGDPDAAILDAVAFAVGTLSGQPPRYRRAIVLFSETIDQSSKTSLNDTLRL